MFCGSLMTREVYDDVIAIARAYRDALVRKRDGLFSFSIKQDGSGDVNG